MEAFYDELSGFDRPRRYRGTPRYSRWSSRVGDSQPRLNEIIHGKRSVTPARAIRFERALGMTAQFWLNLELVADLYDAQHSPAAKDIRKIKPIKVLTAA